MSLISVLDIVEAAASLAGLVAVVVGRRLSLEMRCTLGALLAISCFHGVSNVFEWGSGSAVLAVWEDYLDVVRPVLWGAIFFLMAREVADRELRQASDDLERQNRELLKLDRIKDGLIRDITHELKTPVAKQAMQVEILKERITRLGMTEDVALSFRAIEAGIRRQEGVIRNVLKLAYLESGRRAQHLEPVRIDQVLAEVLEDYRESLAACGVAARLAAAPCTIDSDAEMLWHVFSNLLNNAIKYRRRDGPGKIEISLAERDGHVTVVVADDGIGLAGKELDRAFERFYQGSAASEGIGVGLAICRLVLSHLDGSIRLESPGRGHGAMAIVDLPRRGTAAPAPVGTALPSL